VSGFKWQVALRYLARLADKLGELCQLFERYIVPQIGKLGVQWDPEVSRKVQRG
jgi:hypothetical protein